jgi:hypothetical protein
MDDSLASSTGQFELIRFEDLDVPDRERFCFRYSQQPLSYACTPYLLDHLLRTGHDRVLFFKQESLVLERVDDAIERLDNASILLTPHLVAPLTGTDAAERERQILLSGVFNIGMVGVSDAGETRRLLEWWAHHTQRHCVHAVGDGVHFEQRWMDLAPSYFDGVDVLRDPTYNVAHWNLPERRVDFVGEVARVEGRPLRLFRLSGFDPDHPDRPTRYFDRPRMSEIGDAARLYSLYLSMLEEEGWWETRELPYRWGRFDNGVPIPEFVRFLFRELETSGVLFEQPFAATHAKGFYRWLTSPAEAAPDAAGITNLWHGVWRHRQDVQRVYPDPLGRDRDGFLAWTRSSGVDEHDIPDPLWGRGVE